MSKKNSTESVVREIHRKTRKKYSSKEKVRINPRRAAWRIQHYGIVSSRRDQF